MTERHLPKIMICGHEFPATEEVIQRYINYTARLRMLQKDLEKVQHGMAKIEEHFMKVLIDSGEATEAEKQLWDPTG